MIKLYKVTINDWGWTESKTLYATTKEAAQVIRDCFPAADDITYAGRYKDATANNLLLYTKSVLHPGEVIL